MADNQNRFGKFQCPCCLYYTYNKKPDNTFQTCPVCFWEDDGIQLNEPDYDGGANIPSLNVARNNFKKFQASNREFINLVRSPNEDELA